MKNTLLFLLAAVSCTLFAQRETPAKYWKNAIFEKAPVYKKLARKIKGYESMEVISFEGYAFDGRKGEIKALISLPSTPAPAKGYPALLLLTPGEKIVKLWNSYGYAVMVVPGGKVQKFPGAVKQTENYILAHSVLRSYPKINKEKTGFIALANAYGNLLAGADPRYKFGMNIYYGTCNLKSRSMFNGRFLHASKVPMFWIVKANDPANCPLPGLQQAFSECASIQNKSIIVDLPVDSIGFSFGVTKRFADQVLKDGKALPKLDKAVLNGNILSCKVLGEGKGIKKAILCVTKDKSLKKWEVLPAKLEKGVISASLPTGTILAYFSACDDLAGGRNYFCASSDVWQKNSK